MAKQKKVLNEYIIPVIFEVNGMVKIKAKSLDDAIEFVDKNPEKYMTGLNLPIEIHNAVNDLSYNDGSWAADDNIDYIRSLNDSQQVS